jgi:hypothetical protein
MNKWYLYKFIFFYSFLPTGLPFHDSPCQLQLYIQIFEVKAVRESSMNTELKQRL